MTVIQFPGAVPSHQQVLEATYAAAEARPGWSFVCLASEDGQPYAEATEKRRGRVVGFHWRPNTWGAVDEYGKLIGEGPSLVDLIKSSLG